MQYKGIAIYFIILSLLMINTHQQPTNFNYQSHGLDWSGDCNSQQATKQSPIILSKTNISGKKTSYLFADFRNTTAIGTVFNTTIYIKPSSSSIFFGQIYTKTINSQPIPFKAFQIRIRTRSQHRIQTQSGFYDLQIQISFKQLYDSSKNIKLNLGLLFQAKQTYQQDPFIAQLIDNAKQINQTFNLDVNLNHLLSRQQLFNFWFYQGSATIPPCSNARMNWIIPQKIFKMKSSQLNFFKNIYPLGNWRQIQQIKTNQIGYVNIAPSMQIQF